MIDASTAPNEVLALLDVQSEVTGVQIASPPVVTFTLRTAQGQPITGIENIWAEDDRYVRFTIAKLVPGTDGNPDTWVSYVRDDGQPDYDTGSSLVHMGDGVYEFTFATDVAAVDGVPYEPDLTHRVGGQLGSGSVALAAQNFAYDFVPSGAAVALRRDIAVMESCNECHDDLVFHGRRFKVEYCVTCHNPDLAKNPDILTPSSAVVIGEGDMAYMIHRLHAGLAFGVLDDGVDYSEVTYPQDLRNCRKCHNQDDAATPQGGNWKTKPSLAGCFGCHDPAAHPGGQAPPNNGSCTDCHTPSGADVAIEDVHTLPNATPNNPMLFAGQREMAYELLEAVVEPDGTVVIDFRITSDGDPLDATNLPDDLSSSPAFLLAWAEPQGPIEEPSDYNNLGRDAAQPPSISVASLDVPLGGGPGTLSYDAGTGVMTATITASDLVFPEGATMRAVGLQGYYIQDIEGSDVSLHTPSAVVAVTGDQARRTVVNNDKCASCHEWFEGHGGNRTFNIEICTMCHVPNLSSTGRSVTDPTLRDLDDAINAALMAGTLDASVDATLPLTYPEDSQSLMALVHGIHSAGARTRPFQFVRGPNRQTYYDWEEVTFPAEVSNCNLCHDEGTYEIPTDLNLLPTTVRTTMAEDGMDKSVTMADMAFQSVPNDTDWVNTPQASTCYYCHTDGAAYAHMVQNGGLLSEPSVPADGPWKNRSEFGSTFESCNLCHGPGRIADIEDAHGL
jgi:OmcA/MtrC family decaheme c-type cytochrome